ncbi:alpha/beta hydrolase [Elusimicrobiota bacterium]
MKKTGLINKFAVLISACVFLSASALSAADVKVSTVTKSITFKTQDNWTISATLKLPKKGKHIVIMAHGLGSAKGEWDAFAFKLHSLGFGTLALDLRAHGESLLGPDGNETDFHTYDFKNKWTDAKKDIEAAIVFLEKNKIPRSRIGVMGASIGANIASQVTLGKSKASWIILLSAARTYRGVPLSSEISFLSILLAASPRDIYAFRSSLEFMKKIKNANFIQAVKGHGVEMFKDAEFETKLLNWIKQKSVNKK